MTRDVDLRRATIGRREFCMQLASFDPAVLPVKAHVVSAPERIADGQILLRARIPGVVIEVVAVAALFESRAARADVQRDSTSDQTRERVHLLNKSGRLYESG